MYVLSSCLSFFLCQLIDIFMSFIQESLKYRLLGSEDDLGSWGHEYIRLVTSSHLCG